MLTYAAGLNAVTIIWISAHFTDEHRAALDWLNDITDENFRFFRLEVGLWRISDSVWNYCIGGYQVIKKWLSYREESVQGRALTKDEARYVTSMVRRIASIILMGEELDANYRAVRDNAYIWPSASD